MDRWPGYFRTCCYGDIINLYSRVAGHTVTFECLQVIYNILKHGRFKNSGFGPSENLNFTNVMRFWTIRPKHQAPRSEPDISNSGCKDQGSFASLTISVCWKRFIKNGFSPWCCNSGVQGNVDALCANYTMQ